MVIQVDSNNQYLIKGRAYHRVTAVAHSTKGRQVIEQWRKRVGEAEADRISRETAEWGELVHEITALNDTKKYKDVDNLLTQYSDILPSLLAWKEWVAKTIKKWVLVEKVLISSTEPIAGRIDRVGYIIGDDYPSIVDLKTGELWDEIGIQIWGGYRQIYNENLKKRDKPVHRAIAVQVSRKELGVLRVKDYTKEKYIREWEECKRDYFNSMGR